MAIESTSWCSSATSGNSSRPMRAATSRHRREVSSTLALSTEVTLPRRSAQVAGAVGVAGLVAEVDAAGQFAYHHEVHALQQLGLDRRGVQRRLVGAHRAQVGIQAQRLADCQQALFRAHLGVRVGPLRATDRTQQHRVGGLAGGQGGGRQGCG
ncbi:hypothetical protein G6F59_016000 [Rhizopus arrhizus]|nr:hypothetical protein G6F59_016000 [Rhizopus arrhizus]